MSNDGDNEIENEETEELQLETEEFKIPDIQNEYLEGGCCCRIAVESIKEEPQDDPNSLLKTIISILKKPFKHKNQECKTNEMNNCLKLAAKLIVEDDFDQTLMFAFCDIYLRVRHDTLHESFMDCLNKKQSVTDMKFSDVTEIDSERTPDYIEVKGRFILIVETTVTTDKGKSFMSKGKIESGYKSKYDEEITQLKQLGYEVSYFVVVFDMKEPQDKSYHVELNNCAKFLSVEIPENKILMLDFLKRNYCDIHNIYGRLLSPYFTSLFSVRFIPNRLPTELISLNLTEGVSKRPHFGLVTVSNNVYNKVTKSWNRIKYVLDKTEDDDGNFILTFDLVTNKFRFKMIKSTRRGMRLSDWQICVSSEDKVRLFNHLTTVVDDVEVEDKSRNIEFFIDTDVEYKRSDFQLSDVIKHEDTKLVKYNYDLETDYSKLVLSNKLKNCHSIYEDEDYEKKLETIVEGYLRRNSDTSKFEENKKNFINKAPFSYNKVDAAMIDRSVKSYEEAYTSKNDFNNGDRMILHQKPSFSYPLVNMISSSYNSIHKKPIELMKAAIKSDPGSFTKTILGKVLSPDFQIGTTPVEKPKEIIELEMRLSDIQRSMHKCQMSNKTDDGKIRCDEELEGMYQLKVDYKSASKDLKSKEKELGYKRKLISALRLPTKNKKYQTGLGKQFANEMSHFKSKREKSSYKGVGRFDADQLTTEFQEMKRVLLSPCGIECPDKIYDEYVADDVNLLKQLKVDTIKSHEEAYSFFRGTNLYHTCAMITRFCYVLLYFSQTSIGSDYVFFDNLGVDCAFLICKGGKKIFKTKKSKLYRLCFKTYKFGVNHYSRPGYNTSFKNFNLNGEDYIFTPWMTIDETLLTDGLTFLSRSMGYCILNVSNRLNPLDILSENYFNIMLAIHGRRKTEELMHNMRYLTVNCLSKIANIEKLLPEISDFNYDFFQCYLRENILKNYGDFAKKLINVHNDYSDFGGKLNKPIDNFNLFHLFDNNVKIKDLEQLTMVIYCTFLMSKAPVTQSLEQVKNLRNMLETHSYHKSVRSDDIETQYKTSTVTVDECDSLEDYWNKLFQNDFVYDPKYTTLLGNFCSDYLMSRKTKNEMESKWENIINQNWDSMANTSGLRGDKGKDFFGKKGYYVVYKNVMSDPEYLEKLLSIIESAEIDDQKKRKKVQSLNQTYAKKINEIDYPEAIFHVVDKRQRGGSREIFVMDYKTKLNQQPIEKFMAYLCKIVPNELISIPSNKRLFHIHTNVFEKFNDEGGDVYNVVLDCRRWAPHSVINKFVDFLLGMKDCLPEGFVLHSLNLFEKMFNKKVYTRKYVYDILNKNEGFPLEQKDFLCEDKEVLGYYFNMSYSWMMGIFNYFSSLLHVMNQMHSSQMIMKCNVKINNSFVMVHMNAHSDDSGGKITCQSVLDLKTSFVIYETLLKSSNHMLSDKKCNIGKVYFELLSILYIGGKLLSLLAKFAGSFTFHPTDNGYAEDINEAYSKCIELVSNGSNFDQAYLAFKIMSYLIWRFYFGNEVPKVSYKFPPQLLGMPDSHPLNIILSGGDSDLIRLNMNHEMYSAEMDLNDFIYFSKYFGNFNVLDDSFIIPIKCEPQIIVSKETRMKLESISGLSDEMCWIFNNINLNSTPSGLLRYLLKLRTKNFNASLQDETLTRRISRAYYFRSSNSIVTSKGNFTYSQMKDMLQLYYISRRDIKIDGDWSEMLKELSSSIMEYREQSHNSKSYFNMLNSEVIYLNRSMMKIGYKPNDLKISRKTCKPVHVNIQRVNTILTQNYSPECLTSWICHEKSRWILPPSDYNNQQSMVEDYLHSKSLNIPFDNPNWVYKLLSKHKKKYLKEFFIHSNMPSGYRDINTYKDILAFLSHNSFRNKMIDGILAPYSRTMTLSSEEIFEEFLDDELKELMNMMDLYTGVFKNSDLKKIILKLKINDFDGNIMEYMKFNSKELKSRLQVSNMILPHLECILNLDDRGRLPNTSPLMNSYFHCFLKRQHLIGNVWLGRGNLLINMPTVKINVNIEHQRIISMHFSNNEFNLTRHDATYIDYVLHNSQLGGLKNHLKVPEIEDWMKKVFGLTDSGVYCIGEARFMKIIMKNTTIGLSQGWVVDQIDFCEVNIEPRLKYKVVLNNDIDSNRSIILHTFDLPVRGVLDTSNKLFRNEVNEEIASRSGKEISQYLNDIVGESTESDRKIQTKDMIDNYSITKLYTIIKRLNDREEVNMQQLKLRDKIFPGQEGGVLDMLVKYKRMDPNFLFDFERVLTPELMYLKSTQPELFISNLVNNLRDKYYSLYNSSDRQEIMKSMRMVADQIYKPNSEQMLIKTLTTWGYIGVMGSISELNLGKSKESYKFFKYHPEDDATYNFSLNTLRKLFKSIIIAYHDCEEKGLTHQTGFKLPESVSDLKMMLLSFIHSNALTCYTRAFIYNDYRQSSANIYLNGLFRCLFESESFNQRFNEEISDYPILSNWTTDIESVPEFCMAIKSMMNNFCAKNVQDEVINNHSIAPRHGDGVVNSMNITRMLTDEVIDFNIKRILHNGTITHDFYINKIGARTLNYNGNIYTIEVNLNDDFKFKRTPFNKAYILPRPFKEFDEDDEDNMDLVQDIIIELDCNDPDIDTIEDTLNDDLMVNKCPRKIKTKYQGKVVTSEYFKVKFVNIIGTYGSNNYESYIQNQSETLLILADYIIEGLFYSQVDNVAIFKTRNKRWANKSLISLDWIYIYVKDSKPIDKGLWSYYLESEPVNMNLEAINLSKTPYGRHYDDQGVLVDNNAFKDNLEILQQYYEEIDMVSNMKEEETTDTDDLIIKVNDILDDLEEMGIDKNTIKRHRNKLKKENRPEGLEDYKSLKGMIDELLKEKETFNEIKFNVEETIKKNKSKQFIERVFEVPGVFAINSPMESNMKNRSLKDSRLRCEIESLSSGLTNKILSNTLSITPQKLKFMKSQLKICRVYAKVQKFNSKNKHFLLDIVTMIVNDADVLNDSDCDNNWDQITEQLTSYIAEDDSDSDSSGSEVYDAREEVGSLNYDILS